MNYSFSRLAARRHQNGVVLPVVLVLLVVLTALVLSQIRRGTIDQQLSINSRQYTLVETSAQSLLRFCEARVLRGPEQIAGERRWVHLIDPSGTVPEWTKAANWPNPTTPTAGGPSEVMAAGTAASPFPGVATAECIFENSSRELEGGSPTGQGAGAYGKTTMDVSLEAANPILGSSPSTAAAATVSVCPGSPSVTFCKVRVTARVKPLGFDTYDCNTTPQVCLYLQSELRFSV
jgi:hypothetical protein